MLLGLGAMDIPAALSEIAVIVRTQTAHEGTAFGFQFRIAQGSDRFVPLRTSRTIISYMYYYIKL